MNRVNTRVVCQLLKPNFSSILCFIFLKLHKKFIRELNLNKISNSLKITQIKLEQNFKFVKTIKQINKLNLNKISK